MGWTDIKKSYTFDQNEALVKIHIREDLNLSDGQIEQFEILEGTHTLNTVGKKYSYLNFASSKFKLTESTVGEIAYPNPCMDMFTVSVANIANENAEVKIYNSIGQLVVNENITQRGNDILIPTNQLENGIYIYLINIQSKSIKGSISVQN